ncbi:hypothetical protein [uncultured Cohaesibacter sp.]|uniref:TolB family protein n=1 Tax=uncultured Cohaesibacter sp. TaxID=1002546 RepID=UPI0029301834|nr:hypothetical protein [uncultured Cohaesibacter sp.]
MRFKKSILLIWFIVCLATLLVSIGCERKQETKSKAAAEKVEKKPVFEFAGEEIYGDPEIFSTPRLQFSWRAPGVKSYELWSMRLDGSDLRRVVKADLLYSKEARNFIHDPVRSPDNRYIVISMGTSRLPEKHLIDLKTKTKTIIMSGGLIPHFTWRPDSKSVVFLSDPGMLEYFVETGELKQSKSFKSFGQYILKDGRFAVVREDGIYYYTPDRRFIKSIKIWDPSMIEEHQYDMGFYHRISWDGRFMVYMLQNVTYFIRLDDPKNPIWSTDEWYRSGGFGPEGKYFYYSIRRVDLNTKKEIRLFEPPCFGRDCGGVPTNTTIYNLGAAK